MKKMLSILLAALLVCFCAFAEPVSEELVSMEGLVIEIAEDGFLIESAEQGEVMVLTSNETYVETSRDVLPGDYLYIDYNGQMTRSLPPQITASVVRMHALSGSVIESNPEENTVLLNTDTHGEVMVHLPEDWADSQVDVESMTVYFNGAMSMSLPPQIGAGYAVPGYPLQGIVTEISDGWLMIGEGMEAIQVNFEAQLLPEDLKVGDVVRILYNGQMTRSIPAQVSAGVIIQVSR